MLQTLLLHLQCGGVLVKHAVFLLFVCLFFFIEVVCWGLELGDFEFFGGTRFGDNGAAFL